MQTLFTRDRLTLTEGSVVERVAREAPELLDPATGYAALLGSDAGRALLTGIWREYAAAAEPFRVVLHTPTFRASADRLARSRNPRFEVERESVALMREAVPGAIVAGLIGPRGDCYTPSEAPVRSEAEAHHRWQAERLVKAQCDFVLAATLPACGEALGIADAMRGLDVAYVLSFVVRRDAALLDGTPLVSAIREIDNCVVAPLGYWLNCTHPLVFGEAMRAAREADAEATRRVIGFQANTSPRDPSEYDAIGNVETMAPQEFALTMVGLGDEFALSVLGGCCGTRAQHIAALAKSSS